MILSEICYVGAFLLATQCKSAYAVAHPVQGNVVVCTIVGVRVVYILHVVCYRLGDLLIHPEGLVVITSFRAGLGCPKIVVKGNFCSVVSCITHLLVCGFNLGAELGAGRRSPLPNRLRKRLRNCTSPCISEMRNARSCPIEIPSKTSSRSLSVDGVGLWRMVQQCMRIHWNVCT